MTTEREAIYRSNQKYWEYGWKAEKLIMLHNFLQMFRYLFCHENWSQIEIQYYSGYTMNSETNKDIYKIRDQDE